MRDRPLLVVAARLRADVIDGFLDDLKNSNAALFSSASDKSAEETARETFLNLISRFAPAARTPIPLQPAPPAVLPPCESTVPKTGPRAVYTCGQHAARPQTFAFAQRSFLARTRADVASRIEAIQHFLPPPSNQTQGASMTSSIESFDKAIISRQPNFNDRKTRSEFRKVIPNLKTVVVHCFDPRVTGGIPAAVAKALPGQIYPGEVFEFVGEGGKKNIGTNTTIFPVVVAGRPCIGQRAVID